MSKHQSSYIVRFWEKIRQSKDRRAAPRYSPSQAVAVCVGWGEGVDHKYTKAEIINVSSTGLLLKVDELPPEKGTMWVRLEPPNPTDWIEAEMVRVESPWGEPKTARLRFRDSCPYEIFKAAVNGFSQQNGFMTLPSDLTSTKYW